MLMNEKWQFFHDTLHAHVSCSDMNILYITKQYMQEITAQFSLTEEQRKLMEKMLIKLQLERHSFEGIRQFLGFLVEGEDVQTLLSIHDAIVQRLHSQPQPSDSIESIIQMCLEKNAIPAHMVESIQKRSLSKHSLLILLGCAYACNEMEDRFPDERHDLLSAYQSLFRDDRYSLPYDFFVNASFDVLQKFKAIDSHYHQNKLLNTAVLIASKQPMESLEEFVSLVGETYETIRSICQIILFFKEE